MAFAGLKKQINKANQYMTEKMGGAEGTKLDDEFMEMERKTDVTYELVEELQMKTKEFLQPNPTARAKMAAVKGISKLSGQAKASTYPQPDGMLGDCMVLYGRKLGEDSIFAQSLIETGEALKQMADVKYSLDDNMKQNFLEPLHHLQTKDLKEVMHHRKKLQGRRLDYDCKKRRQAKDDEIKLAEDKFAESLHLAQMGMFNLLENDVEQVSQLATFAEALYEYHQQCTEILKVLAENLLEKKNEAVSRPKSEFTPKTLSDLNIETLSDGLNGAPPPYSSVISTQQYGRAGQNHLESRQTHMKAASGRSPFHSPARSPASTPVHQPNTLLFATPDGQKDIATSDLLSVDDAANHSGRSLSQGASPVTPKSSQLELFPPGNPPHSTSASPLPSPMRSPARTPMKQPEQQVPSCSALYDFDPENPGELGFKEGDIITLINRIDENWYEGSVNGRTGYFPVSYVEVVMPLP